jgi:phage tail-like protein
MTVKQKSSMAHLASDPLRNFKFHVTIESMPHINFGFMSVSGLNITTEVISYREGAMNTTTQKMPGQSDFSPITLSRGVAVGTPSDLNWMKKLFVAIQGTGNFHAGPNDDFRSNVKVSILDHPVTTPTANVKALFMIYNAWPTTLSFGDLDAGASQLLVAQIALAHEGFDFDIAQTIGKSSEAKGLPNPKV